MTRPAADSESAPTAPNPKRPTAGAPRPSPADTAADTKEFSRPRLEDRLPVPASPEVAFRVGWRGYDRGQVDTYRARIESDLNTTRTGYERAVRAHAEVAERLRVAQADLARLRSQLSDSPSALSERLREILDLAGQDAHQTRLEAEADADQIRARASNDAQSIVKQARRTAEEIVNETRTEQQRVRAEAEELRVSTRRELDETLAEAQRQREKADTEATARRNAADREARERRERDDADAATRLTEVNRQVAELSRHRDDAHATLARLHKAVATIMEPPKEPANEPAPAPAEAAAPAEEKAEAEPATAGRPKRG